MSQQIEIVEVGPRDGFQNLCYYIPIEKKQEIIDGLVDAGVRHIQITSFVSPKAIPQMKDAVQLASACLAKYPGIDLFALVPNLRGAQTANDVGMKKVTNVISLSESHNQANIRRSHEQSLAELKKIHDTLPNMEVTVDVATAFGCPFEGDISLDKLLNFLQPLYEEKVTKYTLCDTIGVANPKQVKETVAAVQKQYPDCEFQVHIHDTRGMGMACALAAIDEGIKLIQSTLGGLGGCPFAPGASGNTATEDIVYALNKMGYDTGIDFEKLLKLAKYEHTIIPAGNYSGHHIHVNTAVRA